MKRVPRLSIGLPVYNGEDYLAESLDALFGQTYEDFELIISDNASTDGTGDMCRSYASKTPGSVTSASRRTSVLPANHNFVFKQSRGELFKWAAADDLYGQDLLQRCVDALDEYPDVVLAHAWEAAIDASGTSPSRSSTRWRRTPPARQNGFAASCSEAAGCSRATTPMPPDS